VILYGGVHLCDIALTKKCTDLRTDVNEDMIKPCIAFVIPRGEVIRNFVYSGITDMLRRRYRLVFFTVLPNATLEGYLRSKCDALYELKPLELTYKSRVIIEMGDLAHNKYLWSEASRVRWNMRDVEARGVKQKLLRTAKKQIAKLMATNSRLCWLDNLLFRVAATEPSVANYQKLLKKEKPSLVFNGSHVHAAIAYPLMQAAGLLHVPTASFLFSWDNLTSQGRIFPQTDYYLAWNERIKQDMLRIYPFVQANRVINTGTPQFHFHFDERFYLSREVFMQQLGLQAHDKYVLYSSGMSHHMPYEPEVAEGIADMLKAINPSLKLVVRTYAKDRFGVFDALKERRPDIIIPRVAWEPNFQTPLEEDQLFFTNLLRYCELGVNVASTISLELLMFDKPAINVGYNPPGRNIYPYDYARFYQFEHYKPIVDSGAVEVAWTPAEMANLIDANLKEPLRLSGKRKQMINTFFEVANGRDRLRSFDYFEKTFDVMLNGLREQSKA